MAAETMAPDFEAVQAGQGSVASCRELVPGMTVEARVRGVWHFAGEITEIHPDMELFWAVSGVGERRLIELDEYEVYRLG